MIDYELYAKIRHAHQKEGLNVRQIAKKLGIDRKTVRRWINRPSFAPGRAAAGPKKPKASKLDGFKGAIMGLLERHAYTAAQLLPRLRAEGYTGGYTILKEYVRAVRPKDRPAFLKLHFEPGQCAQVDCYPKARVIQSRCGPGRWRPRRNTVRTTTMALDN